MRLGRYQKLSLILSLTVFIHTYLWITKYEGYPSQLRECFCSTSAPSETSTQSSTTATPPVTHIGNLYDFNQMLPAEADSIKCVPLRSKPTTTICVYPPNKDVYISRAIITNGMWETSMVSTYQRYLAGFPDMGVIDVGSNLGVYTLSAAKAGHKVLAIEPNRDNIIRIHKAVTFDKTVKANIKLLRNAVGDARGNATLVRNKDNQGGISIDADQAEFQTESDVVNIILLDDLLNYIDFEHAIMKIDVEGFEHRAFAHAEKLFAAVDIPIVLMEWGAMKWYLTAPPHGPDSILLKGMVDFFTARQYKPYSWERRVLQMDKMAQWPRDIIWMKTSKTDFF